MASASVPRVPLGVGVGSPLRAPARWTAAPPPGRGGLRRRRADDAGCVRAFDANEGGVPVPPELWARVLGQCAADGARPEKLVEQLLENWLEERSGFAKPSGTFAKAGELERLFSRDEVARLENALARAGEAASAAARAQDKETLRLLNERITAAIEEAQEACSTGASGECAMAWDEVDELSNARERYEKRVEDAPGEA